MTMKRMLTERRPYPSCPPTVMLNECRPQFILSKPTLWFSNYYITLLELVDIAQIEQAKCIWKGTCHTLKADLCSSLQPGDDELAPFGSRILLGLPNNHKWKMVTQCAFAPQETIEVVQTQRHSRLLIFTAWVNSTVILFHHIVLCIVTVSFTPYNTGGPDVPKAVKNNSTCCNLVLWTRKLCNAHINSICNSE